MIEIPPSAMKHHATKLQDYASCNRRQFYSTVLGWQAEETQNHRHFGSCWHEAQEILLLQGYTGEGLVEAIETFYKKYREKYDPTTDEIYYPKTPQRATEALAQYVLFYHGKDAGQHVLHTETYGAVPISHDRLIHFKMDAVLLTDRGVVVREHKTGSRKGRQFTDQWALSFQVGTYNHVGYCLYGTEKFWGVEINGAIFQKNSTDFLRVPCSASFDMLNAWLVDTNRWIDDWDRDIDILMTVDKEDAPVMHSFKRDPTRCTDYYGCEYHAFCMSWANPLQHIDTVPIGFYQEFWDPEQEEKEEATEVLGVVEANV